VRSAASCTSTSISSFAVALFAVMVVAKVWVDPGVMDEALSVVLLKVKLRSAGMVGVAVGGTGVAVGVVVGVAVRAAAFVEPFNA